MTTAALALPGWMLWAPLGAAALHIVEEFFLPGGFPAWYRRYMAGIQESITRRFLILINIGLLVLCYDVVAFRSSLLSVAYWLTITALLASNAFWHAWGAIRTRSYSPGLFTGLVLYIPLASYGYVRLLRSGNASVWTAIATILIGGSYHLWSAAFHKWRLKRAPTNI